MSETSAPRMLRLRRGVGGKGARTCLSWCEPAKSMGRRPMAGVLTSHPALARHATSVSTAAWARRYAAFRESHNTCLHERHDAHRALALAGILQRRQPAFVPPVHVSPALPKPMRHIPPGARLTNRVRTHVRKYASSLGAIEHGQHTRMPQCIEAVPQRQEALRARRPRGSTSWR